MKTLLCAGALALFLAGSATAKPGVATTTVNLRAEANTTSAVLAKIPGGSRIEVGDCTEGWCAVTFGGKSGFAIQTALDTSGRAAVRRAPVRRGPPPGYDPDDDDEFVPAPGYGYGPPAVVGPPGVVYGPGYYGGYGYGWGPYWGYRRGWGGWRRW